jgi:hypothetical protein
LYQGICEAGHSPGRLKGTSRPAEDLRQFGPVLQTIYGNPG